MLWQHTGLFHKGEGGGSASQETRRLLDDERANQISAEHSKRRSAEHGTYHWSVLAERGLLVERVLDCCRGLQNRTIVTENHCNPSRNNLDKARPRNGRAVIMASKSKCCTLPCSQGGGRGSASRETRTLFDQTARSKTAKADGSIESSLNQQPGGHIPACGQSRVAGLQP